ncbi:RbsD/FucU domain-containing protein [Photobacterium sp. OFAV2-7]|uniref:RbsD/FucU domain-containing protein n=1 Tax=Photobacterium sp. OFAV2-7 TaxID=2917748 RepID=UPI001EF617EA|nr:RbsD/FucU domain-containing protein [Photobacterium sp. OFAV2-7]MCG7588002.1 hypothetical protein [Photobacterium sp. OFAV2-7]
MKPNCILHPQLAHALATLGHGDIVLVTDAGFPIPADANRIDLGFYPGTVDVLEILSVLSGELCVEEVRFDTEVRDRNPKLYKSVQEIYTGSGADFGIANHAELVADIAPKAKVIIRSGSFNAYANFALTAATDANAWFTDIDPLPAYVERRKRIEEQYVPSLK